MYLPKLYAYLLNFGALIRQGKESAVFSSSLRGILVSFANSPLNEPGLKFLYHPHQANDFFQRQSAEACSHTTLCRMKVSCHSDS